MFSSAATGSERTLEREAKRHQQKGKWRKVSARSGSVQSGAGQRLLAGARARGGGLWDMGGNVGDPFGTRSSLARARALRGGAARSWPSLRPVSAISLVKRPKRGRSLRAHPAHRPASAGGVGRPSPQATPGRTLAPAAREADWARCRPSVKKQQTARPAAAPHVSTAHVSSPDTP